MNRIILSLIAVWTLMFIGGCAGSGSDSQAGRAYQSLNTGASQKEVRQAMGKPDTKMTARVGISQTADPSNRLGPALPNGTPFEVWRYKRGNNEYRFYFSSAAAKPPADWPLVAREVVPLNVGQ